MEESTPTCRLYRFGIFYRHVSPYLPHEIHIVFTWNTAKHINVSYILLLNIPQLYLVLNYSI